MPFFKDHVQNVFLKIMQKTHQNQYYLNISCWNPWIVRKDSGVNKIAPNKKISEIRSEKKLHCFAVNLD